jgi:hypothetical protein
LVARDRPFVANIEGKNQVIQDVVNHKLTLREAAARFKALNEACPEYDWDTFRRAFPGSTDEERHCRQVLAAVRLTVEGDRARANLLLKQLEAELQGSYRAE